jgi:hypothetical protein
MFFVENCLSIEVVYKQINDHFKTERFYDYPAQGLFF